ncbi:MAG: hypothetical protein RR635_06190 [Oscillospiraceae bacterium]
MKKLLAIALSLTLALSLLTACGAKKGTSYNTPADIAAKVVENFKTNLTENEMEKSIEAYVIVLNDALKANACTAQVATKEDGRITILVVHDTPEGKTALEQELMTFDSTREAFAYLVYTGQVDEQGKVLAAPVVSDGTEQPQDNSSDASADTGVYESSVDENGTSEDDTTESSSTESALATSDLPACEPSEG